jgi:hypothetical protein
MGACKASGGFAQRASRSEREFDGVGQGFVTGDVVNVDAIEDGAGKSGFASRLGGGVSGLPPHSAVFEGVLSGAANFPVFGFFGEFLETTENDNASPVIVGKDFVGFDADERIGAHPIDFLAEGGEAVETVAFVSEIDGNDVGLVGAGTAEAAHTDAAEEDARLLSGHILDQHEISCSVLSERCGTQQQFFSAC